MSITLTPLTVDATVGTVTGPGRFARLNSTASWVMFGGDTNMQAVQNDGDDNFPAKAAAHGMGPQLYDAFAFWETITPNRLILGLGTQLYWLDDAGDRYTYTSPNLVVTTGMNTTDLSILDNGTDVHLANAGAGTTYVWGLDEGSPIGVNPPQEANAGGGFWGGCSYSPDGTYLASARTSNGLAIWKRSGDSYSLIGYHTSTSGVTVDGYVSWSADGNQVAVGSISVGQNGVRVFNRTTGTDTFTNDGAVYGNTAKHGFPLYCGEDGNTLLCFSTEDNTHTAYTLSGAVLTQDTGVNLTGIPAVTHASRASARTNIISVATRTSPYFAIFDVAEDTALSLDSAFTGFLGSFDAAAKLTAQIENADFDGLIGSFDALLVDPSGDPGEETIRHGTAQVRLEGTATRFDDVAPTFQALQASFVGPKGSFAAEIALVPDIDEANFVSPFGRFDASLFAGSFIESEFVGPTGNFDAELDVEVPLDIGAMFVGPMGVFDANLEHFSVDADFVGPMGQFAALVLGSDGLFGDFVGLMGSSDAMLKNNEDLSADFVGPSGGFSAQLGEDMRTMEIDFVGPFGAFDAILFTVDTIIAGFVGPMGAFATVAEVHEEITADFVSPFGHFDALVTRGQRLDAFFRSPFGHFDALLEKNNVGRTLPLLLIQP